jgi:hypothetical protein
VRSDLDLTDKVITLYNQGAPGDAGDKTGKEKAPGTPKAAGPTPLTPPVLPPPAVPVAPK